MGDHTFCRLYLKEVMTNVKEVTKPEQRKKVWTWRTTGSGMVFSEVHSLPSLQKDDAGYWSGNACCLWYAKASGWSFWLSMKEIMDKEGMKDEGE